MNRDENQQSNIWLDGIMGLVVGDALGCPVQFKTREELRADPVTGMRGHGTYDMSAGSWTDDGSLALATVVSIIERRKLNLPDIMYRFALWLTKNEYTPTGEAYDVGTETLESIVRYIKAENPDVNTCGSTSEDSNGNGSLMRILPACLYLYEKYHLKEDDETSHRMIYKTSGLTHNHLRSKIACAIYYFMVCEILDYKAGHTQDHSLLELLQNGVHSEVTWGDGHIEDDECRKQFEAEMQRYSRLSDLKRFRRLGEDEISSSVDVAYSLEAAVWCLLNTSSYKECELKAVNLGEDTDTVAAIAGGLAGIYYGYESIPQDWLNTIQRREWIEELCRKVRQV